MITLPNTTMLARLLGADKGRWPCRIGPTASAATRRVRTDVPQHPEIWGDLCGWYRLPARLADAGAREMAGAGVEVPYAVISSCFES